MKWPALKSRAGVTDPAPANRRKEEASLGSELPGLIGQVTRLLKGLPPDGLAVVIAALIVVLGAACVVGWQLNGARAAEIAALKAETEERVEEVREGTATKDQVADLSADVARLSRLVEGLAERQEKRFRRLGILVNILEEQIRAAVSGMSDRFTWQDYATGLGALAAANPQIKLPEKFGERPDSHWATRALEQAKRLTERYDEEYRRWSAEQEN